MKKQRITNKTLENNEAITLIALVITIVVLIILASVTINLVLNENGIFRRAKEASDSYKISEYKERIDIAVLDAKMQNIQEPIDFLGRVKEILENDSILKDATIKRIIYENKDTLVIVVSDYAFTVDDIEVKYVGKAKDFTIPDATETNIIFKVSTLEWTDVVNVEIETTEVGYEIEYRIGEKEWNKYTQALEITENTTVDARLVIGSMYGEYVRKPISNIDNVDPTATISELNADAYIGQEINITVEHFDNSEQFNMEGCKWVFTTVQEKIGLDESLYTGGTFTENPQTITVSGTQEATYYLHVLTTDKAGNKVETVSTTGVELQTLTFTSQTFSYKGSVESFTIPADGVYKLEVWGAKGGNARNYSGGNGGYSIGYKQLTKGQIIYICVGGQGSCRTNGLNSAGGYNGGGSVTGLGDYAHIAGSGGGATHIATVNRGTLGNYNSYRSEVLIVAGGGGGAFDHSNNKDNPGNGGSGGGTSGGGGSFGNGGSGASGGGGGGWSAGINGGWGTPGSGGTGYTTGTPSFSHNGTTYAPSMSNGARSGNGQAQITFVTF